MRDNTSSLNAVPTKTIGIFKRISRAYRNKKRADQTFFATIVALQVSLVLCILLVAVLLLMRESTSGSKFLTAYFM